MKLKLSHSNRPRSRLLRLLPLLLAIQGLKLCAAEPEVSASDLPRLAPTSVERALGTFKLKPGFQLEIAAAEPQIADPVAMAFDEFGRIYAVEMRDYSERRDERLGRIVLLEDRDRDGRYERSTVFAEGLPWPTALTCYDGGVFVGAMPDILYLKDTDGDGRADSRRVAYTGFGSESSRPNVQQLINSFDWSLDQRIQGALGGNPSKVSIPDKPGLATVDLRGRDFSFDPRSGEFRPESGGAQHGMSFDSGGRKFVCSNSDHIQLVLFEDRWANPWLPGRTPRVSIAADGPAAEVFRASPDEAWRVLRTRWRVSGVVPGLIEGGGRPSGYFTGATGTTIYQGDAWPPEYQGDAFIADCGSNLVHRKKLRPDGVSLLAQRAVGEEKSEFLVSTDNWFRPVQFANGPDGNLYVLDMYREVIEHPWSLPPGIKQHLDLNSGNDRGRIYRIVATASRRPNRLLPGEVRGADLARMLFHSNSWHRLTAARLIHEGRNQVSTQHLLAAFDDAPASYSAGRIQMLAVLAGEELLQPVHLIRALNDEHEQVRAFGAKLAIDAIAKEEWQQLLLPPLARLVRDPSAFVRYHAVFALSRCPTELALDALVSLLEQSPGDPWIAFAASSGVGQSAPALGHAFLRRISPSQRREHRGFIRDLATITASRGHAGEVAGLLDAIDQTPDLWVRGVVLPVLRSGTSKGWPESLHSRLETAVRALANEAGKLANDQQAAVPDRLAAIESLRASSAADTASLLLDLLLPLEKPSIQRTALEVLFSRSPTSWVAAFGDRWPSYTPTIRRLAIERFLAESSRSARLLELVSDGRVAPSELDPAQRAALRDHPREDLRQSARRVLGAGPAGSRTAAFDRLKPALQLAGDAASGARVFAERCASCHRLGANGTVVGPDLASARSGGAEKLLASIVDPNREVASAYVQYAVEVQDGETLAGIMASESDAGLTLRQAGGLDTFVPRSKMRSARATGLSLMPEALEDGLTLQQMADLLAAVMAGN